MVLIRIKKALSKYYGDSGCNFERYKLFYNKIMFADKITDGYAMFNTEGLAFAPDEFKELTFVDIWELKRNGTFPSNTNDSSNS